MFSFLDRTGKINRSAIEKEFLCQSCFTGIRVGNNGKGSSFIYFFFKISQGYTSKLCFIYIVTKSKLYRMSKADVNILQRMFYDYAERK